MNNASTKSVTNPCPEAIQIPVSVNSPFRVTIHFIPGACGDVLLASVSLTSVEEKEGDHE